MVFRKYVEIGRVVFVNFGPLAGRLAVIVDILNTSKLLISGPTTGVRRQEISINRVSLTDLKLDVVRGVKEAQLKQAIEAFGLEKKWGETSWARKIQRATRRAQLTDFDRFKVKTLKQKRSFLLKKALKQ
jgi:large subunit ribosomal protein L14e